jgi:hypothetical protein
MHKHSISCSLLHQGILVYDASIFFRSGMATYLFFLVKLRVSLCAALSVRYILGIVCRDILNCAVHSVLQCQRERTQSCVDISSACVAVSLFLLDSETYRTVHILSRLSLFAIKLFSYSFTQNEHKKTLHFQNDTEANAAYLEVYTRTGR